MSLGTSFADDEDGALVRRHLAEAGVSLASDPHVVARTSRAVVTAAASSGDRPSRSAYATACSGVSERPASTVSSYASSPSTCRAASAAPARSAS